jgi:hypothetical protein
MQHLDSNDILSIIEQLKRHGGGAAIPKLDHRDRDFLKSFGAAVLPKFPDAYNTDAGIWMPDQSQVNAEFPDAAPQPMGCTNFTSADLSTDLNYVADQILRNPAILEAITHASAKGGAQIRDSLLAAKKIGWINGFYNVTPTGPFDYFDSLRLAMFSGQPEKRSVSIGTPWFPDWAGAVYNTEFMPMPKDTTNATALKLLWHNWKLAGWETINGQPWMRGKIWGGKQTGKEGWLYFDRPTINTVMHIKWAIAFTATMMQPDRILQIDLAIVDRIASIIKSWVKKGIPNTPPPVIDLLPEAEKIPEPVIVQPDPVPSAPKFQWNTPAQVRHSVRVLCDEMGMTYEQKDTMCATIQGESQFNTRAKNENKRNGVTVSTDWGLCQINDYYHIGEGRAFPSVAYVLNNPEAVVRWMGMHWLQGRRNWWIAYKSGAYRKYLTK